MLIHALIYLIVCGIAWSWILNLDFSLWKLPFLGAFQAILVTIGNDIIKKDKDNQV